jgi:protein-tyrosine phosphatase
LIDLHSHILPGIDDGSRNLDMSLEMARLAVADGIEVMACTPHIYPGLYMNDSAGIRAARDRLQAELKMRGIPLKLSYGADVHLVPGVLAGIRAGTIPTLHGSRYLLLEPPHHVAPPRFADHVFELVAAGYVPVITHPERLSWIEDHYEVFVDLANRGTWMQVTASALTGLFGPRARYWGERLLGEGLTHILATDCHSNGRRIPVLSEGLAVAERLVGAEEARRLVHDRPAAIINNLPVSQVAPLPHRPAPRKGVRELLRRWI